MTIINKESFSEQIYEDIKKDILNHKIGFNQKLTNRDLQEKYGVSSTPVRDAINRLYLDGFVEEISKTGAKTIGFDRAFALEINEVISILSDDAIQLSASKSDIADVADELEEKIKLQKMNINNETYYSLDEEFHLVFFKYCNNKSFVNLYERYNTLREILIRYTYGKNTRDREFAIEQHILITQAYRKGNINLARERMHDHYRSTMVRIQKEFQI